MRQVTSINEISSSYQGFIVDLWGVLHDGVAPYPGALEALSHLKDSGKVALLSNAPRRADKAEAVLHNLGFHAECRDTLLTSGEAVFHFLEQNRDKYPPEFHYLGPEKDRDLLGASDYYTQTDTPSQAGFVITTGLRDDEDSIAGRMGELEECLAASLPMICANPDLEVVRQTGERLLCAGLLAMEYKKMGGHVQSFGKPYPYVYHMLADMFAESDKICTIGDSLHTDIRGANNMGYDSLLITGGILKRKLHKGGAPDIVALQQECDRENARPTYFATSFTTT